MLEHGGRLRKAAKEYAIPLHQWLDLSTGINPCGWPVPADLPLHLWNRLPEEDDGLYEAAVAYYGSNDLLPVAGSQAAIQSLPQLRRSSKVLIPSPAYAEHAHAWRKAGHQITLCNGLPTDAEIGEHDVLLIINPNNPTGRLVQVDTLLEWRDALVARGGWLIVDEAFIDTTPDNSLATVADKTGLIVLRSLGKFFGLAGVRLGFVVAEQALLSTINERLGPWCIAGPSRAVATMALTDTAWQSDNQKKLRLAEAKMTALLKQYQLTISGGTALFQWVKTPKAKKIAEHFAQQGILLRYFAEPESIRFGLPGNQSGWDQLERGLASL